MRPRAEGHAKAQYTLALRLAPHLNPAPAATLPCGVTVLRNQTRVSETRPGRGAPGAAHGAAARYGNRLTALPVEGLTARPGPSRSRPPRPHPHQQGRGPGWRCLPWTPSPFGGEASAAAGAAPSSSGWAVMAPLAVPAVLAVLALTRMALARLVGEAGPSPCPSRAAGDSSRSGAGTIMLSHSAGPASESAA